MPPKNDGVEFNTGNDLNALGFTNNLAKQGIIKLMFSVLIIIILSQQYIIYSERKTYDAAILKCNESSTNVLLKLLEEQNKTKALVDTSYTKQPPTK